MDTIVITGALDPTSALDLRVRLDEALARLRPAITVDLSSTDEVHLAGVAALASARRRAERRGGSLHVVPPSGAAIAVLQLSGLVPEPEPARA